MQKLLFVTLILTGALFELRAQPFSYAIQTEGNGASVHYAAGLAIGKNGEIITAVNFTGQLKIGNSIIESSGISDILVLAFDEQSGLLWYRHLKGESEEMASSLKVDTEGNIIVTGAFSSSSLNVGGISVPRSAPMVAMFVAKISSDGNVLWVKSLDGDPSRGQDVDVDSEGNIYVATFTSLGGDYQTRVVRFDPSGNSLPSFNSHGIGSDYPYAIAVDTEKNIYLAGSFTGDFGFGEHNLSTDINSRDGFVVRLNADGTTSWMTQLAGDFSDAFYDLAIGPDDHIYVTGTYEAEATIGTSTLKVDLSNSNSRTDLIVAKLTPEGTTEWARNSQISNAAVWGFGIAVSPSGEIYVTGDFGARLAGKDDQFVKSCGAFDAYVLALDPQGNTLRMAKAGGEAEDTGRFLAFTATGSVYVTGEFASSVFAAPPHMLSATGGGINMFVARLDSGPWTHIIIDIDGPVSVECGKPWAVSAQFGCQSNPYDYVFTEPITIYAAAVDGSGQAGDPIAIGTIIAPNYPTSLRLNDDMPGGTYRISSSVGEGQVYVNFDLAYECGEPPPQYDLFIPNVFTPNGDRWNDTFRIEYDGPEHALLKIYSPWGKPIASADARAGWTGEGSPDGNYFFTVSIGSRVYKGWVRLVR